ncbi:hypothetical protein SBP1_gp089 [Vibrio virus vB_VspP_SBP1]|uniref:Uncharacterized protein n=1 Tax=Vibrio virus vB_VspP_SBP1 TaxID=2500581 RepID=A0A3T0IIQ1_9CAUD|nr:hypothetical protein KNU36_gp040 [Vibrio virus vB_VspP_SBP1]AZU99681.1 hypothetical protein SBP1_gp089 [Vibrio virus vB_VspP_SBP1]
MTKQEFAEACAGVGVWFNPKSLRIYRNYGFSHQIGYITTDYQGNVQRVVLLESTNELECFKALRTLIMIHGLSEAKLSTDWGRQMG